MGDNSNELKQRSELKQLFSFGKIPDQEAFGALIDAVINQGDDGIQKSKQGPLQVQAATEDARETQLRLFTANASPSPQWTINTNPLRLPESAEQEGNRGLNIQDEMGISRFFIDETTGNIGLGGNTPDATLAVAGKVIADNVVTDRMIFQFLGNSQKIMANDENPSASFGEVTLSADGNTFLIQRYIFNEGQGFMSAEKKVYVYRRQENGPWIEEAILRILNGNNIFPSFSLSADGNTALIYDFSTDEQNRIGKVYVYRRQENGHWIEETTLKNSALTESADFGSYVSLSGDGKTASVLTGISSSSIFQRKDNGSWVEEKALQISVDLTFNNEIFDTKALLSGDANTVLIHIVTREMNEGNDLILRHFIHIFRRQKNGDWQQETTIKTSDPDTISRVPSIALSDDGNVFLCSHVEKGAVLIFERQNGGWQRSSLKPDLVRNFGIMSNSVALSGDGNLALIGFKGLFLGAYVFRRQKNGPWIEQTPIKIRESFSEDQDIDSLALSADGKTAIIVPSRSRQAAPIDGKAYMLSANLVDWLLTAD